MLIAKFAAILFLVAIVASLVYTSMYEPLHDIAEVLKAASLANQQ